MYQISKITFIIIYISNFTKITFSKITFDNDMMYQILPKSHLKKNYELYIYQILRKSHFQKLHLSMT